MSHLKSTSVGPLSRFFVITEEDQGRLIFGRLLVICGRMNLKDPTKVHIQITVYISDYSHEFVGSALVRFKRSTLPENEGTRTSLLRFLKMITPVKCASSPL
jgi:hypothetical protein